MTFDFRFVSGSMVAVMSACLLGCLPQNDASEQVQVLAKRIDFLERELDAMRAPAPESSSPVASDQLSNLERRINDIETARGQTQSAIQQEFRSQNDKLQRMFRGFNQMQDVIQTGQTWAVFGLGYQGHTVARTRHGSFLIELQSQEPDPKGYHLKLRIGNPTGLHVYQFKLFGDYGSPPPDITNTADYETYIKTIDQWEGSLMQFEANFANSLAPNEWTTVGLVIPAKRLADLRFIRFRMEINRTGLDGLEGDGKFARFGFDHPGATMLETKHGTFLLTIQRHRKVPGGYELDLLIGNPLGMTITSARLTGRFGRKAPPFDENGDQAAYSEALISWDQSLKPFNELLPVSLIPFHWNAVTITLPAKEKDDMKFIQARLDIQNVSLRNPD